MNEGRKVKDEVEEDELKKIKDEFREDPETVKLRVNRVPKYVSDDLKSEANRYFGGDYGMALTFWHREQKSLKVLEDRISELDNRISRLEEMMNEILNKGEKENQDKKEGLDRLNA